LAHAVILRHPPTTAKTAASCSTRVRSWHVPVIALRTMET
jgi:hypothetical protein